MSFNTDASKLFDRMSQLLELTGADRFRVNAHAKAARVIKEVPTDLEPLAKDGDTKALTALEGIGKGTATKLIELAQNGDVAEYDELMSKVPSGLLRVLEIQGLGPKTVKLMWDEKNVENVEDLKKIIDDGSILELPRMGQKTVDNIARSLEFLDDAGKRLHIGIAMPIAQSLVAIMYDVTGVTRAQYAGSLRRGQETIGDIDILVASDDPESARDAFLAAPGIMDVLAKGDKKCSARFAISSDASRWGQDSAPSGVQVDLRIVDEDAWGAAIMYFTGSKEHNVKLRERAITKGLTLNEYGLFEDDGSEDTPPQTRGVDPIAGATESDIYKALGLPETPPTLREDRGETALDSIPDLVQISDIVSELHSHTTDSDGRMSLEESATIAKERGFHTLAITDHSRSSAVANGLSEERLREQIKTIRAFNKDFDGIEVLCGSEVDILVDGSLDYDDDLLHELDVVVASPHAGLRAKPKQATKRLLKAIEHPMVHIIGHPTGRLIERRPGLEPDFDELIAAALEHDVALEINAHWMRLDLRDTHVRAAADAGCKLAIDCDVHHASDYDNIVYGVLTSQRGWLPKSQCVNTWSKTKLHAWLKSKR